MPNRVEPHTRFHIGRAEGSRPAHRATPVGTYGKTSASRGRHSIEASVPAAIRAWRGADAPRPGRRVLRLVSSQPMHAGTAGFEGALSATTSVVEPARAFTHEEACAAHARSHSYVRRQGPDDRYGAKEPSVTRRATAAVPCASACTHQPVLARTAGHRRGRFGATRRSTRRLARSSTSCARVWALVLTMRAHMAADGRRGEVEVADLTGPGPSATWRTPLALGV